ncbi:DUF6339 family protein [Loktanella salsilacus]|uniref:DUF6339 family protein n=1 Tax=Loktanella salsilacus TaxID=195913 RepID=UPI0037038B19
MIKYLRQDIVDQLYEDVPKNLELYRTGSFDYLASDPAYFRELDVADMELVALTESSDAQIDAANSELVWQILKHLTPAEARDRRLWVYLSHVTFLGYARSRYPIPQDDDAAVKTIRDHWFAVNNRSLERNQAVSRLWWFAFMAKRVDSMPLRSALDTLLYLTDVRANLMERPTTAQCAGLFKAWIEILHEARITSEPGESSPYFKRPVYRTALKRINAVGGYKLLDSLDDGALKGMVKGHLELGVIENQ